MERGLSRACVAREVLRAAVVLGLGPCCAGRYADTAMMSNGHHEHEQLCVGRSTTQTVKSTILIASLLAAHRSLCWMARELAPVDCSQASIVGVGLRIEFPRNTTY
jgi:hypothetical protein